MDEFKIFAVAVIITAWMYVVGSGIIEIVKSIGHLLQIH